MTETSNAQLVEELKRLKSEERPAIIRAIAEAREHGDLSENAEYHAARDRQSFIEGRVAELEDKLSRAEVIDTSKFKGKVIRFGATVTLADDETGEKATYKIVGTDEADINSGLLSITSPLAKALITKSTGDEFHHWIHGFSPRALPDQIEPFDRDDFFPRLGALRMAMQGIGKDAQRRHGGKASGLRWCPSAPRVRCGPRPMRRIALRPAPTLGADEHPSN